MNMAPIFRTALSILGGLVVAGGTIALVESFGHALPKDWPFAIALMGYALGAALGASLTAHFAGQRRFAAWGVIALLAVLALINIFAMPHPWWFAPGAGAIFLTVGWWVTREQRA